MTCLIVLACVVGAAACGQAIEQGATPSAREVAAISETQDDWAGPRRAMVETQLRRRGIADPRVLAAMEEVPRHRFVPPELERFAYDDRPLPIGLGQTISQPYIVAYMTDALKVSPDAKVLEVGTGSGYQAAILGDLVRQVFTIEIVRELGERARATLSQLGYENVEVRVGDGYRGWPEQAPFDAIMVTAAPDHIPQPLIDQLAVGGRLLIPVGDVLQEMTIITKTDRGIVRETTIPVRFVPMTGEAQRPGR